MLDVNINVLPFVHQYDGTNPRLIQTPKSVVGPTTISLIHIRLFITITKDYFWTHSIIMM
jgi:hypothetical protein